MQLVAATLTGILQIALYRFATDGTVPGFDNDKLRDMFRHRGSRAAVPGLRRLQRRRLRRTVRARLAELVGETQAARHDARPLTDDRREQQRKQQQARPRPPRCAAIGVTVPGAMPSCDVNAFHATWFAISPSGTPITIATAVSTALCHRRVDTRLRVVAPERAQDREVARPGGASCSPARA